jgi:3D (Asp-Asp-Asp) domain-containing protein
MNNNGKMEPSKYNLTKLGIPPIYDKTVAVDPKVIPLGSTVKIAGVGTFLAADTGKLIKGTRIDIAVADCEEAIQFGKQNMKVRIVKGEWK